jgi:hypothetical protein
MRTAMNSISIIHVICSAKSRNTLRKRIAAMLLACLLAEQARIECLPDKKNEGRSGTKFPQVI